MKIQATIFAILLHVASGQNDEFCDMCGGSGTPSNTELIIPFLAIRENDNPTCKQVFDFGKESVSSNDDICALIQSHEDFCGCPGARTSPVKACSLCEEGATPANLNAITPFGDTCSELDVYLKYLPKDLCPTERVGSIQRADAFCGCPGVEPECYMCDDDTNNLSHPDRKIPFYVFLGASFTTSCQEYADFYTLYDTEDPEIENCDVMKMESRYCGCQSNTNNTPVNACKLCSDGSSPASTDRYIDEIEMTCGELETYLSYAPADQCTMPWIRDLARFDYFCGCPSATAPCPICPDGTTNISNPDAVVPYLVIPNNENPTCQELATLGVIADPGELVLDDCSIFENQAAFCGCPGTAKPTESCSFCPNGDAPANADTETPFGDTCEELDEYLSYLPSEQCGEERIGFIQRQDFLCGCPSATTGCALCSNDGSNNIEYPDRHIPLLSLPLNPNPTCGQVVEFLAINDGDLSDAGCTALQEYQGYCGCSSVPVKKECSFCPNGGTPSNPTKVVSEVFTCQGLYDFVSFLPENECGANSKDFKQIQAYAYLCGCPNVDEPHCSLCMDGITVPDPEKLTGDSAGTTCGEYAELVASLTFDQCAADSAEIQAAKNACGCGVAISPPSNVGPPATGSQPATEGGACLIRQNADLCTKALLDSVTETCDCYAFCDSTFVGCQSAEGGLLEGNQCNGTPITGCNRDGIASSPSGRPPKGGATNTGTSSSTSKLGEVSEVDTTLIIGVVVPVLLALLVVVYYFCTRGSIEKADKTNTEMEGNNETPLPVQKMEGSLSMADVVMVSPSSVSSPPTPSFSIDEDEAPVEPDPENKIV